MITSDPMAGEKIRELILGEPGTIGLREYVKGKGSHGHQYDMSLESKMEDEDMGIEMRGVKVIMDSQRAPLLLGPEVDSVDSMRRAGFVLKNPQTKTTCGCGSSFSA